MSGRKKKAECIDSKAWINPMQDKSNRKVVNGKKKNYLIIFRPICWVNTLWQTLTHPGITAMLGKYKFVWFSGHEWQEMEGDKPIGQNPLECVVCGLKES